MNQLHFCSGLPRTGSTVLMNILQQNPEIFTTSTCALTGLLKDHVLQKSRVREHFQAMSADQADDAMYGFVRAGTKGWYEGLTDKPIVISKNREWPSLAHLFPESKFVACVRDLRDIVESFDKINSNIKALHSYGNNGSLYKSMTEQEKYNYYFHEGNAVSYSLYNDLPKLMELFKIDPNRVLFIRYEDFLLDPHYFLNKVYSFLNIDYCYYNHDLNNIQQSSLYEHDHAYYRERTSHKVKPSFVKWKEPVRKLSDEFHSNVINNHKWFYEGFYPEVIQGS